MARQERTSGKREAALNLSQGEDKPWCTQETLLKSSAYKKMVEKYYSEIHIWRRGREERKRRLDEGAKVKGLTDAQSQIKLQQLNLLETQYLRSRRTRVNLNSFEKRRLVGRGGFGEVWLVEQKNTGRPCAMKIMRKSKLIRKRQELHVYSERNCLVDISELYSRNPWIVQLYYSFQDEEHLYLIMEYIPGGDMMHLLIELDVFSIEMTKFYIAEIILAVASIHKLFYIHRDIKPDNILLDSRGHIKLTDFGLCTGLQTRKYDWAEVNQNPQLLSNSGGNSSSSSNPSANSDVVLCSPTSSSSNIPTITYSGAESGSGDDSPSLSSSGSSSSSVSAGKAASGSLPPFHNTKERFSSWKRMKKLMAFSQVGTPDYCAPEVLSGSTGYGMECDWWSVGVIMFEMLAGGPPFSSDSPLTTRNNVLNFERILADPNSWQKQELDRFPTDARDLLLKLMCRAENRLGVNGVKELKEHPFFHGIDFDNIRNLPGPYIPQVESPWDCRNFPLDEILEDEGNSPLNLSGGGGGGTTGGGGSGEIQGNCDCTTGRMCEKHLHPWLMKERFVGFTYNSFQAMQDHLGGRENFPIEWFDGE